MGGIVCSEQTGKGDGVNWNPADLGRAQGFATEAVNVLAQKGFNMPNTALHAWGESTGHLGRAHGPLVLLDLLLTPGMAAGQTCQM